jgi:hypothetical protein
MVSQNSLQRPSMLHGSTKLFINVKQACLVLLALVAWDGKQVESQSGWTE